MTLDSGAASSLILNTENPKRSRIFKIVESSKNYIHNTQESTDDYQSDDEDESNSDDNSGYNTCFALDIEGRIEPPMPGLELRFCLKDILIGLRQNENVMSINNITAEVTLMARISRPGTGYDGFSDSSSSNTSHKELYN